MTISITAVTGLLGLVKMFYPPAAPVIGIIEAAAPYIQTALPIIQAGIEEGPGAFAAAKAHAPQLASLITKLADQAKALNKNFGSTDEGHVENIARVVFGQRTLSHDEEMAWMNRMTPGNDPSQENSKFPIG